RFTPRHYRTYQTLLWNRGVSMKTFNTLQVYLENRALTKQGFNKNRGYTIDLEPSTDGFVKGPLVNFKLWKDIINVLKQTKIKEFTITRIDEQHVCLEYSGAGIKKGQITLID